MLAPLRSMLLEREQALARSRDPPIHFSRPAIDPLFESVAESVTLPAACAGRRCLLSGAESRLLYRTVTFIPLAPRPRGASICSAMAHGRMRWTSTSSPPSLLIQVALAGHLRVSGPSSPDRRGGPVNTAVIGYISGMSLLRRSGWHARAMMLLYLNMDGCSTPPTAAIEPPRRTVDLTTLALSLDVPEDATLTERGERVRITLMPRTRHPQWISLARADTVSNDEFDREDGALRYRTDSVDAGNGGGQHRLFGRVEVDGHLYDVTCKEESKDPPRLGWCLHFVRSLRARHGTSASARP